MLIDTPRSRFATIIAMLCLLSACSISIEGDNYQNTQPQFDLYAFFEGDVEAWGIVQDRSGEVVQRFTVDIRGTVKDGVLILDEQFTYGVGQGPDTRQWQITSQGNGRFVGRANDIEGPAQGLAHGNAFNFRYEMDLPVGDTTYKVAFDDWFWAFDQDAMMNRSYIRKFGFVMAEVTIFMKRRQP